MSKDLQTSAETTKKKYTFDRRLLCTVWIFDPLHLGAGRICDILNAQVAMFILSFFIFQIKTVGCFSLNWLQPNRRLLAFFGVVHNKKGTP